MSLRSKRSRNGPSKSTAPNPSEPEAQIKPTGPPSSASTTEESASVSIQNVFPTMTPSGLDLLIQIQGDPSFKNFFTFNNIAGDPHDPQLMPAIPNLDPMMPFQCTPPELGGTPSTFHEPYTCYELRANQSDGKYSFSQSQDDLTMLLEGLFKQPSQNADGLTQSNWLADQLGTSSQGQDPVPLQNQHGYFLRYQSNSTARVDINPAPPAAKEVENDSHSNSQRPQGPETSLRGALTGSLTEIGSAAKEPGRYGFEIRFPDATGKIWIYRAEDDKLFVKTRSDFDVEFHLKTCPPVPFTIEASAVHQDQGKFGQIVMACATDIQKYMAGLKSHQFLYSEKLVENIDNKVVIKVSRALKKSAHGCSLLARYRCLCSNSCVKAKANIFILFQLKDPKGRVLGQRSLDIRSCACPNRDSALRTTVRKNAKGRKRDLGEMSSASPELAVKTEAAPVTSSSGSAFHVAEANFSGRQPKLEQSAVGLLHSCYRDGNVVKLDLHVSVLAALGPVLATHLQSFIQMFQTVHDMNLLPGSKVSVNSILNSSSGVRTTVAVPARQCGQSHQTNINEIKRWMHDVVGVSKGITHQLFLDNGINTLDEIFELPEKRLKDILVEMKEDVIAKFLYAVSKKDRPSLLGLSSQSSQQQY